MVTKQGITLMMRGDEDNAGKEGHANQARNVKLSKGEAVRSDGLEEAVLSASHPGLVQGVKQVQGAGLSTVGNPTGLGLNWRLKEKALKDITNQLEAGPVSLKPSWSGPRFGAGVVIRERGILKSKSQEVKARPSRSRAKHAVGSSVSAGPYLARPPDINNIGRGGEALNRPNPQTEAAERSTADVQQDAEGGSASIDDVMFEVEQERSPTRQIGQQFD